MFRWWKAKPKIKETLSPTHPFFPGLTSLLHSINLPTYFKTFWKFCCTPCCIISAFLESICVQHRKRQGTKELLAGATKKVKELANIPASGIICPLLLAGVQLSRWKSDHSVAFLNPFLLHVVSHVCFTVKKKEIKLKVWGMGEMKIFISL